MLKLVMHCVIDVYGLNKGDVGVGKTSVMNRFVNNDFSEKYDVHTT